MLGRLSDYLGLSAKSIFCLYTWMALLTKATLEKAILNVKYLISRSVQKQQACGSMPIKADPTAAIDTLPNNPPLHINVVALSSMFRLTSIGRIKQREIEGLSARSD